MSAAPEGGTLSARLELDGLLGGDYVLRVDEVLSGGTSELGRLPFRVEPKAR
jgi:hypothetical protein